MVVVVVRLCVCVFGGERGGGCYGGFVGTELNFSAQEK